MVNLLWLRIVATAGCLLVAHAAVIAGQSNVEPKDKVEAKDKKDVKRPALSVRASPMMAFAPARLFLSADLRGGPNDYEEYYCPTVEWDWDDGTVSQSTVDCDPYEAGKSEIKRRYSIEHIYRIGGNYKVEIRLKRKDKVLAVSSVTVQIRAALNEPPLHP
jgi:catalase (peroxidase I)